MVDAVLLENKHKPLTLLQVETASFLSQGKSPLLVKAVLGGEIPSQKQPRSCLLLPFMHPVDSCTLKAASEGVGASLLVWAAFCRPVLRSVSAHTCFRRKIKSLSYIHTPLSPPASRAHWHNWHTENGQTATGEVHCFSLSYLGPFSQYRSDFTGN